MGGGAVCGVRSGCLLGGGGVDVSFDERFSGLVGLHGCQCWGALDCIVGYCVWISQRCIWYGVALLDGGLVF